MATMATSYSNPEALSELSNIIERTLIDTGRLFRKSGSMPSRTHLQRSIPLYHDSFQNALDNLSEQIFIAKAFLEKDYEALQTTSAPIQVEDVKMSDMIDLKPESPIQPEPEKTEMETEMEIEPEALKSEEPAPVTQPTPAAKPEPQEDQVPIKKEGESTTNQAFPGTNEDLTFDSVLNDTGNTNDFGLSLDFNDDDMGNQAFLSGSNFADKPTPQPPAAGGDAFDMELQKTEGDEGNFLEGTEDFMGPAESNFDDLFLDTENFEENGDFNQLEGGSLMNVNELDDNWFN